MADVANLVDDEYGPQIRACDRLAEYAKGVTKSWPAGGRPMKDTSDGLIVALFTRNLDTFMAAVRLASLGYGAQASMLNRSLFEDMIDAHWVATDPDTATQRYRDHQDHGRMLLADAARKHPDHYGDVELPEFDAEERKRLDHLYGEWGSKPWSGINLHKRVGLVEHHWGDEPGRHTLRFFHDIAHRENNQTLHVSSASLNASMELSSEGEGLTFLVGPRLDMLDRALFGSFWIFDNTIGLILERFEIETGRQDARGSVHGARLRQAERGAATRHRPQRPLPVRERSEVQAVSRDVVGTAPTAGRP